MAVLRGRRVVQGALQLALAWTGAAGSAHAQAAAADRTFSLDYTAPPSCPKAAAVVGAIQARSAGASVVSADAASVRLTIELLPDGQSKLWVDLAEGSFRREFVAASCVDAVASMAVMAAMVIEAEPAARRAMTDEGLRDVTAPEPPPAEPEAPVVTLELAPQIVSIALPRPVPPRPRRKPAPSKLRWAVAGATALESAIAPESPWGVRGGLEAYLRTKGWWAPSLQVGMFKSGTGVARNAQGEGRFSLLSGHVQGCLVRFPATGPLRALPCVLFEAGSLSASGEGAVQHAKSTSMPWWAGGAALRGQLDIVSAFSLEVSASIKALARKDKFIFQPSSVVYELPRFSYGVGLGFLLRLP